MATAAAEYNPAIKYCMSNPSHALQSVEFPAVTQVSKCSYVCSNRWLQHPQITSSLYSSTCLTQDMPYKVLNSQLSLRKVFISLFEQMAAAAAEYTLTLQYCMHNPRHAFQTLKSKLLPRYVFISLLKRMTLTTPAFSLECVTKKISITTYVVGTQNTVLMRELFWEPKRDAKIMAKNIYNTECLCLAKPVKSTTAAAAAACTAIIQYCMSKPRHPLQGIEFPGNVSIERPFQTNC